MNLPNIALSVWQPWAWLIANGLKDVENRTWSTRFRGPVLIHASKKTLSQDEMEELLKISRMAANLQRRTLPTVTYQGLRALTGGIVGVATVTGCAQGHESPWANREPGTWHWTITDARPLPFMPCKGALGLFRTNYVEKNS